VVCIDLLLGGLIINPAPLTLARWLVEHYPRQDLTPLKLQKLVFYAVGAAIAYDATEELGDIRFRAWKLGPVNIEIYRRFKADGATPLSSANVTTLPEPNYSGGLEEQLRAVLSVYGHLTAASLVEETHREVPWAVTYKPGYDHEIDSELLSTHFKAKFAPGSVLPPSVTFDPSSFTVDGIPVSRFESLLSLATALDHARVF